MRECPKCHSQDVKPILYGYVDPWPEDAACGGCTIIDAAAPVWECGACGWRWGRLDQAEGKDGGGAGSEGEGSGEGGCSGS